MAGEIYIADKLTLDDVNRKITEVNKNNYFTVSDIVNSKYVVSNSTVSTTASNTYVNALNITGSGLLYMVIARSTGATNAAPAISRITVDNSVIDHTILKSTNSMGYISGDMFSIYSYNDNIFAVNPSTYPLETTKMREFVKTESSNMTEGLLVTPKPIRYTGGFKVDIKTTTANSSVSIYYAYIKD